MARLAELMEILARYPDAMKEFRLSGQELAQAMKGLESSVQIAGQKPQLQPQWEILKDYKPSERPKRLTDDCCERLLALLSGMQFGMGSGYPIPEKEERKKKEETLSQRLGKMVEHVGAGFGSMASGREFAATADFMRGGGKLAGAIPEIGPGIEKVAKFTAGLMEAVDKLKIWTRQLHEGNMKYAEFSPHMRGVQIRQMMWDIAMSREKGEARAASAEKLAEAMRKVEYRLAPIENYLSNILSETWAEILNDTVVPLLEAIKEVLKSLNLDTKEGKEIAKGILKSMMGPLGWASLLKEIFFGKKEEKHGQPARHAHPGVPGMRW